MNRLADAAHEPAIELRFGQVGLAQLRVRTPDCEAIRGELTARMASAPQLFERAAVCLDLGALTQEPDLAQVRAMLDAVRSAGMLPIGLAHGTASIDALARELDLPVLTQFRAQSKAPVAPLREVPAAKPAVAEAQPLAAPTLMHHTPVRSGQRIYARHRDLVVTSTVGAGAEVIADGCIHIYGVLRGRAMAGARGEISARVFCQEFRAELVSIAGVFRVLETIPPELLGKPVQVWLDGDDLKLQAIA